MLAVGQSGLFQNAVRGAARENLVVYGKHGAAGRALPQFVIALAVAHIRAAVLSQKSPEFRGVSRESRRLHGGQSRREGLRKSGGVKAPVALSP
ncbi:MAG: hypothetical protein ACRD1A_11845, partial [Terriglobales bacterium]